MQLRSRNRLTTLTGLLLLFGLWTAQTQARRLSPHRLTSVVTGKCRTAQRLGLLQQPLSWPGQAACIPAEGSSRRLLQDELPRAEQLVVSEQELQQELDQEDTVDFPLGTFGDEALTAESDSTQAAQSSGTEPFGTDATDDDAAQAEQLVVLNPDSVQADADAQTESESIQTATEGEDPESSLTSLPVAASTASDSVSASQREEEALIDQREGSELVQNPNALTDSTGAEPQTGSHSSEEALTGNEGLAGQHNTTSTLQNSTVTDSSKPLTQLPILESALPTLDGLNNTLTTVANASLNSINGSLQAAISESESTSNVTASPSNSSTSISNSTGALGAAVNAGAANETASLLEQVQHWKRLRGHCTGHRLCQMHRTAQ